MSSSAHSSRRFWPLRARRLSSSRRRLGSASARNTSSTVGRLLRSIPAADLDVAGEWGGLAALEHGLQPEEEGRPLGRAVGMERHRFRQPPWVKRTTVSSPWRSSSKVNVVSIHSSGPSRQRHATRSAVTSTTSITTLGSHRRWTAACRPRRRRPGRRGSTRRPPRRCGQGPVDLFLRGPDADAVPDVDHGRLPELIMQPFGCLMMRSQLAACQPPPSSIVDLDGFHRC